MMSIINPDILSTLRQMAECGETPPKLLDRLLDELPRDAHKVTLIRYMRAAFGLTLEQASPIAGWSADRTGELSDAQLTELVAPYIESNRSRWQDFGSAIEA